MVDLKQMDVSFFFWFYNSPERGQSIIEDTARLYSVFFFCWVSQEREERTLIEERNRNGGKKRN